MLKCKLECIEGVLINLDYHNDFAINEGDILNCEINDYGVSLEYEENRWSMRYKIKDISKFFKII